MPTAGRFVPVSVTTASTEVTVSFLHPTIPTKKAMVTSVNMVFRCRIMGVFGVS